MGHQLVVLEKKVQDLHSSFNSELASELQSSRVCTCIYTSWIKTSLSLITEACARSGNGFLTCVYLYPLLVAMNVFLPLSLILGAGKEAGRSWWVHFPVSELLCISHKCSTLLNLVSVLHASTDGVLSVMYKQWFSQNLKHSTHWAWPAHVHKFKFSKMVQATSY